MCCKKNILLVLCLSPSLSSFLFCAQSPEPRCPELTFCQHGSTHTILILSLNANGLSLVTSPTMFSYAPQQNPGGRAGPSTGDLKEKIKLQFTIYSYNYPQLNIFTYFSSFTGKPL